MLRARGVRVAIAVRRRRHARLPAPSFRVGDRAGYRTARWILIATPDDQIRGVAERLSRLEVAGPETVVLHLSGAHDRSVLEALAPSGAALGSFHPLQTFAVPTDAERLLPGSYAGIEGDGRAVRAAVALAKLLGATPVRIPPGAKPAYHAAATLVAGYITVLFETAAAIATHRGFGRRAAHAMYLPLLKGTVANLERLPPADALTGAIRRGDVGTVRSHLAALTGRERELYRMLGIGALALAKRGGLAPDRARTIGRLLAR